MEALPPALVLSWSATTFRVKCPFCLNSHGHGISGLLRKGQRRSGDCHNLFRGESYRVVYPDEECDFTSPFGWELNKVGGIFYSVTHEGRLRDPLDSQHQPRRLLDKYQNSTGPAASDEDGSEDGDEYSSEDAIAESVDRIDLSKSDEHNNNPTHLDDAWGEDLKAQSFRYKLYISACCLRNIGDLKALFYRYPQDLYANAADNEGSNGIFLAAADDGGLDTVKWLREKGVAINQENHYGRTALMEAALWGRLETVKYLVDNGADIMSEDANGHRASDFANDTEQNDEERISRASGMVHPDANRKRRQILEYLMRQEIMIQGSHGVKPLRILPGYL